MSSTRIPYPDPKAQSEAIAAQLERTPSVVVRMLSHASDPIFAAFNQMSGAVNRESSVDPKLREVAILRVGYLSDASFEIDRHEAAARRVGLTDDQIAAIKAGGSGPALSPLQQNVAAFANEVVLKARPSDAVLARLRGQLTDNQLMDLILLIGCYMTVARVLETTGIDADAQPDDWKRDVR